MGLHFFTSNRLEILSEGLAEALRSGTSDPLIPENVLVQSKGMQRWLFLAIARINGICANIRFPFPNSFLESLYAVIDPGRLQIAPYDKDILVFRIFQLLPGLIDREEFQPLKQYISQDSHPLKLFQLSGKIATVFDQYSIFRPEMTMDWANGKKRSGTTANHSWQAVLWRNLTAVIAAPHPAARHHQLIQYLSGNNVDKAYLPERLFVFGISHLPPFHLEVLEALSRHISVFMFLLNPCRHYWSDIVSDHQLARIRNRGVVDLAESARNVLHFERGNRLLASLGHQGKHFFDLIHQYPALEIEKFQDNDSDTLLGSIQQDILDLNEESDTNFKVKDTVYCRDSSIQVHCCHSPMREVEVLFDCLLDTIEHHPGLTPRDILVMTPDIDIYAPYIHAVFGSRGTDETFIPFSVADQAFLRECACVECFMKIVDIYQSRFEVSKVMALIGNPAIHQKFGLAASDLPLIERWIRAVEIRWGWDQQDRIEQGLPGFEENSWRAGLDRLLLGYAMHATGGQLFAGVLPLDEVESDQHRALSGMVHLSELLHKTAIELIQYRRLTHWKYFLSSILDQFFLADDTTLREMRPLRGMLDRLEQIEQAAGFDVAVPILLIQEKLKQFLSQTVRESGFFSGGVTFCAMLPMRSIPCKMICLLGLNHDAFPRETHEPGFNLLMSEPRPGDRQRRSDDRYLFLESLISARQVLYLSYVGRDIQDNSEIPASVVVDELMEYIHDRFGIESHLLLTCHALHGFSPTYFEQNNPKLFSYSKENREAAQNLSISIPERPFFQNALSPALESMRDLQLVDLNYFYINPTRYLCNRRLGIFYEMPSTQLGDRERFVLNPLDRFIVNQSIFDAYRKNMTSDDAFRFLQAGGQLPHGSVGRSAHRRQDSEVRVFMRLVAPYVEGGPPRSQAVDFFLGPFHIQGIITDLYPETRVVVRLGKIRPRDLVTQFLVHLIMVSQSSLSFPAATVLIGSDCIRRFGRIEDPLAVLDIFLKLYWQGMHAPLSFFEKSSHRFAEQVLIKRKSSEVAMASALKIWQGDDNAAGEAQDRYISRSFDTSAGLPPDFEANAITVFGPIFDSICEN